MGFFKKLFGKESGTVAVAPRADKKVAQSVPPVSWVPITKFIPISEPAKNKIVAIIATAIAAGENKTSQFTVTRIQQLNPEFKRVALIATSIAAGDAPEKQFIVQSIKRKID